MVIQYFRTFNAFDFHKFLLVLGLLLIETDSFSAVWQWSVEVKKEGNARGPSRAYLWIPPKCKNVKTVIFAQNNMEEQSILEDNGFREKMAGLGVAEVWVSASFDLAFRFDQGSGQLFDSIMNSLANVSGYAEIKYAPIAYMGHSAAASAPYYFAAWNPQRTLAAISVSGQWPYVRNQFAPDIWGGRNIDYIPCLETMGEYEAASTWSAEGLKERREHPLTPLSMLACPAEGHFAYTPEKAQYIALYIKKAMQYRLPSKYVKGTFPRLIPINPETSGWLADKWRKDEEPKFASAPVAEYKGDPKEAFWFFDGELARATSEYQAKHRNKKVMLLGYLQNGKMVDQRNTHQQVNLKFEPEADGVTFKLRGGFLDTVPGGSPRPSSWTGKAAGSAVQHPASLHLLSIDWITGPVVKVNDSTFRVQPNYGIVDTKHSYEAWFALTHPGDESFRPAVQQSIMPIPLRNEEGADQIITFPPIMNQKKGKKRIELNATSSSGAAVFYYVKEGPAEIKGNILTFTGIPVKSRYPLKVTVVAGQYGRGNSSKLKTAQPAERTFFISK